MPGHVCSASSTEEDVDEPAEDEEADGDEEGHSEMLLPTTRSRSAVSKFMPWEENKVTYDDVMSHNSCVMNCHSLRQPWAEKIGRIGCISY